MRTNTRKFRLALTSLTVLVLSLVAVVVPPLASPVLADGPTTITLPSGSLTTAIGAYQSAIQAYPHKWDITKGDLIIEGTVDYGGIQARGNTWDGDLADGDDWFGVWPQIDLVKNPVFNSSDGVWMVSAEWTGGGDDVDTQIREILHMQEEPGTQPMPKWYTGPRTITGGDGDDTYDFKLQIHSTDPVTGSGWAKLWIDTDRDGTLDLIKGDMWSVFVPEQLDYTGEDLSNTQVLVGVMNGNNTNNPAHTFSWSDLTVTGYSACYDEVRVDDDWAGTTPGTEVEPGKYFGFNAFATIQDGVDHVCGSTVHVAAGTYNEQITINKSLTLQGAGAGTTTIQAPGALAGDADGNLNIVTISGAGVNVEFTGFTVSGPHDDQLWGMMVRDSAYANIHDNEVKDIRPVAGFGGGQSYYGIAVGRNFGHSDSTSTSIATATIKDNNIHDYNKYGITVTGDGSNALIQDNTVTGVGHAIDGGATQDGIGLNFDATATIRGNTVTNHLATWAWGDAGDGIALWVGVHDVLIEGNTLTGNSGGILIHSCDTWYDPSCSAPSQDITIQGNAITGNHDGITFPGTVNNCTIKDNTISNNDWHGIWSDTNVNCPTDTPSTGISIIGNDILNNGYSGNPGKANVGIYIGPDGDAAGAVAHFNNIVGNEFGVQNDDPGNIFDATNNWWDSANGPEDPSVEDTEVPRCTGDPASEKNEQPAGQLGDKVVDDTTKVVDYCPWTGVGVEEAESETITGTATITDTLTGGDVTITATNTPTVTVTTAKYESNPGGGHTFVAEGYFDVNLDTITDVGSVEIEFCPATESTVVYYWDGTDWLACGDQHYENGCVVVTIPGPPGLDYLTSGPFASGHAPPKPVGGVMVPVSKFELLASWIGLAALMATAIAAVVVRRRKA